MVELFAVGDEPIPEPVTARSHASPRCELPTLARLSEPDLDSHPDCAMQRSTMARTPWMGLAPDLPPIHVPAVMRVDRASPYRAGGAQPRPIQTKALAKPNDGLKCGLLSQLEDGTANKYNRPAG